LNLSLRDKRPAITRLSRDKAECKTESAPDNYDYILNDRNPSLNVTKLNAYLVADSVVLVSDNSLHSWRAIETINRQ
jgi:cellulose biosynthesis protein BcsQ